MQTLAPLAVAAGANVLVAGTAIFGESEGRELQPWTGCEPPSSK